MPRRPLPAGFPGEFDIDKHVCYSRTSLTDGRSLRTRAGTDRRTTHPRSETTMFESRWRFVPTAFAMTGGALDDQYASCWAGLRDRFR